MSNIIKTHAFSTASDLLEAVSPFGKDYSLEGYIFRGQSQERYQLVPSALRIENEEHFWKLFGGGKPINNQWQWETWQISAEYQLLRNFYRSADRQGLEVPLSEQLRRNLAQDWDPMGAIDSYKARTWLSSDLLDVAALAQHYGIPTRLLDWTYDPFIALYFAFIGGLEKEGNIIIWCLNKEHLLFLKPTIDSVNIDFITPHYSGNPNLNAQQGLFTHWPITIQSMVKEAETMLKTGANITDRSPLDLLVKNSMREKEGSPSLFIKLILPCSEAKDGRRLLDKLGYDTGRVFPGYKGIADQILKQHTYIKV